MCSSLPLYPQCAPIVEGSTQHGENVPHKDGGPRSSPWRPQHLGNQLPNAFHVAINDVPKGLDHFAIGHQFIRQLHQAQV